MCKYRKLMQNYEKQINDKIYKIYLDFIASKGEKRIFTCIFMPRAQRYCIELT